MRSFLKIFYAGAILLYTSCAEDDHTETIVDSSPADSPVTQDTQHDTLSQRSAAGSDTVQMKYPGVLLNWEKELQERGVNFDLDKFYAASQHDFYFENWNPLNPGYAFDRAASPDSSYFTYTVPGWSGGEPDTYLFLIDAKKKREITLEVYGTCCSFEGSGFSDNHTLVAYGYENCSTEIKYPDQELYAGFYVVYNFNTMVATYYSSKNFFNPELRR